MKTYLDCIPCFIKQPLEAARMATADKTVHEEVIKEVLAYLGTLSFSDPPPKIAREVHAIVKQIAKCNDPYKKAKEQSNITAKTLYPILKDAIDTADDPLFLALTFAIMGNVIDFGFVNRFEITDMMNDSLQTEGIQTVYPSFHKALEDADTILYILDNTGEIYFDKALLEEFTKLHKTITCVVKEHPILNDATLTDAKIAGLDRIAHIISSDTGQNHSAPGTILQYVSEEFVHYFTSADLVIAKGQGNYESLNDVKREIFFMLVAKCPLVARNIGGEVGDLILKVKK